MKGSSKSDLARTPGLPEEKSIFPKTRWTTLIDPARQDDDMFGQLLLVYYRPMEIHLTFLAGKYRLHREPRDLLHEFLNKKGWLRKEVLNSIRRDHPKNYQGPTFRAYLKRSLNNFVIELLRKSGREVTESDLPSGNLPEERSSEQNLDEMDIEFARIVWDRCMGALERECRNSGRALLFTKIRPHLECRPDAPSYQSISSELTATGKGWTEGAAKKAVHDLRKAMGSLITQEIDPLVGSSEQCPDEARYLLSVLGRTAVLGETGTPGPS